MNTEQERAEFEAWASHEGKFPYLLERVDDYYRFTSIQYYWAGWQARAALAANAAPQISDAIFLGCARLGLAGASDEEVLRYVRTALTT